VHDVNIVYMLNDIKLLLSATFDLCFQRHSNFHPGEKVSTSVTLTVFVYFIYQPIHVHTHLYMFDVLFIFPSL